MQNHEIVALFKDKEFKAKFIENYTKAKSTAKSNWTVTEAEAQWNLVFALLAEAYKNPELTPIHLGSVADLRICMAYVSETGLSFDKRNNEVHLVLEYLNGKPVLRVRLGYKGMMRIAMSSGLFKFIFVELVREGDTFAWNGANKEPVFVSSARSNRAVQLGFVGFKYIDGDCLYLKVDGHELLEIEKASKAYTEITKGSATDSLYNTPWRDRMFEIAVWRIAYNKMRQVVSFGTLASRSKVDEQSNVQINTEELEGFMETFGIAKKAG